MTKYTENDFYGQMKRLRVNLFSLFPKMPSELVISLHRNNTYKNSRFVFYENVREYDKRQVWFEFVIKFSSYHYLYIAINAINQILEHCERIQTTFSILEAHKELKAKKAQYDKINIGDKEEDRLHQCTKCNKTFERESMSFCVKCKEYYCSSHSIYDESFDPDNNYCLDCYNEKKAKIGGSSH